MSCCEARWHTRTVLASFNVEEFGTERVARLERPEIDARLRELHAITQFSGVS